MEKTKTPYSELSLRHLCVLFRQPQETTVPVQAFIQAAMRARSQCLVLSGWFAASNPSGSTDFKEPVIISETEGIFSQREIQSMDLLIRRIRFLAEQSVSNGFSGLRIIWDMRWLLRTSFPERHLFEFENRINQLIPESGIYMLCLYDLTLFPECFLPNILFLHPFLWRNRKTHINPHFLPMQQFADRLPLPTRLSGAGILPEVHSETPDACTREMIFVKTRQFMGNLAHALNNQLSRISLGADILRNTEGLSPGLQEEIDSILDAGKQIETLTRRLLHFASAEPALLQPVDLSSDLSVILPEVQDATNGNLNIKMLSEPGIWPILADISQISELFMQLGLNAWEACGQNGRMVISLVNKTVNSATPEGPPPGKHVQITIEDNGPGIPPEILPHVMEPFFTTRKDGHGMGLPIVQTIVENHHGTLQISNTGENSARIRIWLPAVKTEPVPETVKPDPAGMVLVLVEDEPSILSLMKRILEQKGFVVHCFSGPELLLTRLKKDPFSFDMLITDVVMPGMNGFEMYEVLRQSLPAFPAIFISGFTADVFRDHRELPDHTYFLPKPFLPNELLALVDQLLG